jgi:hypothetical protein
MVCFCDRVRAMSSVAVVSNNASFDGGGGKLQDPAQGFSPGQQVKVSVKNKLP